MALLIHRFRVELVPGEGLAFPRFPQLDDTLPALGIPGPKKGMDIYINL